MSATRAFVDDRGGFTTLGTAVALLLVLALVFGSVRVFRVQSSAGNIQYVADAGALAADNAVAEFVTVGQAVDATLLSLSLLGLSVYAASGVAAFVPGGQGVAANLAGLGAKVLKLRDSSAKSALKGLGTVQKVLPALCALRAASCVKANSRNGRNYHGFAVVSPAKGKDVELPDDKCVEEAGEKIEAQEDTVVKQTAQQEEARQKKDAAKEAAWRADCGAAGMCMRERASHLAGLSGALNPSYSSSATWSFSVPLERARAYYSARFNQEPGSQATGSPELVGESVARKRFYSYAYEEVGKGAVRTSSQGAELPDLRYLARNTSQIRETVLYTEPIYPLSSKKIGNSTVVTLHAWTGCPGYSQASAAGYGSVSAIDGGNVNVCAYCKFSATTLGRVPSASTSIGNGFEYYYRTVVENAGKYRAAVEQEENAKVKLKKSRKAMVDAFKSALKSMASVRYDPQPPGRYGCVCVVFAGGEQEGSLPFAGAGGTVGTRVAISGASLAADPSGDASNVIGEVGAGLVPQGVPGSSVVKTVFGAWGSALRAYSDGNAGVEQVLNKTLGALPLVGTSLSEWAVSGFKSAVEDAGLEPANLRVYKPVLVNTEHVVSKGEGAAAKALLRMKAAARAYGDVSEGDLRALAQTLGLPADLESILKEGGLEVLRVPLRKLGLGGEDGTLRLPCPDDIRSKMGELLVEFEGVGR